MKQIDIFDEPLTDLELLAELTLTTELIIAASNSIGPLNQQHIDDLLGLHAEPNRW